MEIIVGVIFGITCGFCITFFMKKSNNVNGLNDIKNAESDCNAKISQKVRIDGGLIHTTGWFKGDIVYSSADKVDGVTLKGIDLALHPNAPVATPETLLQRREDAQVAIDEARRKEPEFLEGLKKSKELLKQSKNIKL